MSDRRVKPATPWSASASENAVWSYPTSCEPIQALPDRLELDDTTVKAMETAITDDRRPHRHITRSQFSNAVRLAIGAAKTRAGGVLPPAPPRGAFLRSGTPEGEADVTTSRPSYGAREPTLARRAGAHCSVLSYHRSSVTSAPSAVTVVVLSHMFCSKNFASIFGHFRVLQNSGATL